MKIDATEGYNELKKEFEKITKRREEIKTALESQSVERQSSEKHDEMNRLREEDQNLTQRQYEIKYEIQHFNDAYLRCVDYMDKQYQQ